MVVAADPIAQNSGQTVHRLRLRALDEPLRNEEVCVLHPLEQVIPDQVPELDLARPGRIARFQLLMDAVRLGLTPGDDRLVSSARSRIQFEPYQQVPALRALELPRPRLLIADDVGLGKTIEAGLILRELNARRRANRILIVSPASIVEQWQTELASKFGFQFKIFDSEGVAEARRAYEVGTNPWCAEPRVIASIDYIKRREGAFRQPLGCHHHRRGAPPGVRWWRRRSHGPISLGPLAGCGKHGSASPSDRHAARWLRRELCVAAILAGTVPCHPRARTPL